MLIEDLLSENLIDFSMDEKTSKNKESVEQIEEIDKNKLTRLQIVTIHGEIVDV